MMVFSFDKKGAPGGNLVYQVPLKHMKQVPKGLVVYRLNGQSWAASGNQRLFEYKQERYLSNESGNPVNLAAAKALKNQGKGGRG